MQPLRLRCPECRHLATFDAVTSNAHHDALLDPARVVVGQRRCPNPECHAHVFVVYDPEPGHALRVSYPPELIDFDTAGIPDRVVAAMSEAIQCHGVQCYTASAIMVRKTLEELCADRGAKGDSLRDRLLALRGKVVLPEDMFEGLDDLRLLGNDATHVESRVFEEVGQEEVEIGIEFSKEVLKAVYQHASLVERLRSLKAKRAAE
jgi:Domain of unknown function (DUF4145)